MIALVDCNNFYASCERVFRPDWEKRPLAVLSNNDGCVIARSEECKTLGIPMGVPLFQIPPNIRQRTVFVSSNYTLYGDMSRRVIETLKQFTPDVEVYSIDESFLNLAGFSGEAAWQRCRTLYQVVHRNTGIPVSVGLSTSHTLAKVANRIAKKHSSFHGVCMLEPDSTFAREVLATLPVTDLWGVSSRLGVRFSQLGITTAWQLREAEPKRIRQHFSIVQENLVYELRGISRICMDDYGEPKKHIMTSRSFGQLIGDKFQVQAAIRAHAVRGAEKLRAQSSLARAIHVQLKTNKHRSDLKQYTPSILVQLPCPSNDGRVIAHAAQAGLERIWRNGYRFIKAGVMMLDLVQCDELQADIFNEPDARQDKSDKLNAVIDQLNRKMGRGTVRIGDTKGKAPWKLKADMLTPRYTTRWEDIPTVLVK